MRFQGRFRLVALLATTCATIALGACAGFGRVDPAAAQEQQQKLEAMSTQLAEQKAKLETELAAARAANNAAQAKAAENAIKIVTQAQELVAKGHTVFSATVDPITGEVNLVAGAAAAGAAIGGTTGEKVTEWGFYASLVLNVLQMIFGVNKAGSATSLADMIVHLTSGNPEAKDKVAESGSTILTKTARNTLKKAINDKANSKTAAG